MDVQARATKIRENYAHYCRSRKAQVRRSISARLLLIHTVAHALINQWALECGYPAGSLRERLYVGDMKDPSAIAGILVYTATTDSAGSLGGLIGLADLSRLRYSVTEALHRASWCSADPVCIETIAAGASSLNLAACHACALLPEVSCEEQNVFLDRGMLFGTPEWPEVGYFGRYGAGVIALG